MWIHSSSFCLFYSSIIFNVFCLVKKSVLTNLKNALANSGKDQGEFSRLS